MSPSEIVQYLASRNSVIDDNANARLSDDQVSLVIGRFAPHLNEVVHVEATVEPEVVTPEVVVPGADVETVVEAIASETPLLDGEEGAEVLEEPELIKAPKVTLTGLKVLGKIELPEAKKKEPTIEDPREPVAESARPDRRTPDRKRSPRAQKNPIALQREHEMNEEMEKRKQRAAEAKERKTQNYLKKVKHSPPTKAVRMIDEPTEQLSAEELKEEPRSWLGKFVKWLSS